MRTIRGLLIVVFVCLISATVRVSVAGQSDAESAPAVDLGGPDILKADWKTRAIRTGNLNQDPKPDIAVLNNNHARIDLYLYQDEKDREENGSNRSISGALNRWEPSLTDAPFVKKPLVTGIRMFDLEIGDVNGDGKQDLVYTGSPDDVTVRLQEEKGSFPEKKVFDLPTPVSPKTETLEAVDVNRDQKTDLVVLGKKEIFVYLQSEDQGLKRANRYTLINSDCSGLRVLDITGDQRIDLVFTVSSNRHPLRVRPGLSGGGFGPERMFDIQAPKGPVQPITRKEEQVPSLAYIQKQTEMITLLQFFNRKNNENDRRVSSLKSLSPRVYSAGRNLSDARYAMGDFNGDQRPDIVVVDPEKSELIVFWQGDSGVLSEPESFPAPEDLRSITAADVNGDGGDELFMVSRGEELLGISHWKPSGRISYPAPISISGKPLAVTALKHSNKQTSVAVVHAQKNRRMVSLLEPADKEADKWTIRQEIELSDVHIDPVAVRALDCNQDQRDDLAVFAPGSPVYFLLQNEQGKLAEARKTDGSSGGGLQDTKPSVLHAGDLNGDDVQELFLARENYLRSISVNDQGQVQVHDQYNAESSEARVTAGLVTDLNKDGTRDLLLLDEQNGTLQLLQKNEDGVYRFVESAKFGQINQVRSEVLDFDGDGENEIFVFGKKKFWRIPVQFSSLSYTVRDSWKIELEDVKPTHLSAGDLNDDGREDLLALDAQDTRILGIYSRTEQKSWSPVLFFKVFSSDPHYRGKEGRELEPREAKVTDVTGDRKKDVLLLVHNRILIYPQK